MGCLLIFTFLLFLGMVMCANEFTTTDDKSYLKQKIDCNKLNTCNIIVFLLYYQNNSYNDNNNNNSINNDNDYNNNIIIQ